MAELVFFTGTMDCGKSTLALQMDHNHAARGRRGIVLTQHDRAGEAVISSRLGLRREALEVNAGLDLWDLAVSARGTLGELDYVIADEVQSGFARTGAMFASEHFGIVPDLITTAKGIAGGMPLAAVTGRAEIMDAVHAGDLAAAREHHFALDPVQRGIMTHVQGAVAAKAVLAAQGVIPSAAVRLPLVQATPDELSVIRADLAEAGITF